ncbi:MAG: ribonuclease HII [Bacteroides sp.]|nr:ribonuclease HII [Bacteroides sp.]
MDRKQEKLLKCRQRFEYDKALRAEHGLICGVDEAGRGPWIGAVYAAAVVFDDNVFIDGLDDSKKLSEAKREALYDEITAKALSYSVAFAATEEIEELNILNAAFLAMRRAVQGLSTAPDMALVDGNRLPELGIRAEAVVKGDGISASIAAASILAKVTRDRYMKELDRRYPEFGFASNKGYGTAQHVEALKKYGYTPEHRLLFLRKLEAKEGALKAYGGKRETEKE